MSLRRQVRFAALCPGLAALACGGSNGGTPPGPTPTVIAKVSGDSQVGTAGAALSPFAVIVKDASGNPVANVAVTWAVAAGGGSITTTSTTDVNGTATAVRTLGSSAGTQTATASRSGLTGSPVTFTSFSQIQGATSIAAGAGSGQTDTVLSTLATPVSVVVKDYNNVPVSGVTVTWSGTGATPGQATTTTDGSGVASNTFTLGSAAGPVLAIAAVSGLVGSPVQIAATATAGHPTQLALSGGNNQFGTVNTALTTPHSVVVHDAHGNVVPGVSVAWAVGDGGGSVSATSTTTGSTGTAAVTRTLGPSLGTNTDTAAAGGLTGSPVVFTATAVPPAASVSITNDVFTPGLDTISVGQAVTWTWNCNPCAAHNVSSTGGPATFRSGNPTTATGTKFTFQFTTAGTYTYQCEVHGPAMSGTIVVK